MTHLSISERYADCPGCGQEIGVFDNRTYLAHGTRQADGDLIWCPMSYQPIPPACPVVVIDDQAHLIKGSTTKRLKVSQEVEPAEDGAETTIREREQLVSERSDP